MNLVLADSSYWVALLNADDSLHEIAINLPVPDRMLLTQAVQLEVMDAFSSSNLRPLAMQFWNSVQSDPNAEIVSLTQPLMEEAVNLFEKRNDKRWSLTDCISFIVMKQHNLHDAFTHDHHFEQAGFRAWLRTP